ncbi:MAG TPA: hypothetical protein VNY52_05430 [Solirubrobacteraceae bacterium]|jgi:hypothetical protein|nr:hypothetical protein [Solirubrobacteraceae bacterium]
MQDQGIREPPCSLEATEQRLLWLLQRPIRCRPWHTQELAREIGDPPTGPGSRSPACTPRASRTSTAGFAHATRAAVRFRDLSFHEAE